MKNYKRNDSIQALLKSFFLALTFFACSSCAKKNYAHGINYVFTSGQVPGYGNLDYWASHPWKYDPADNTPSPLGKYKNDSLADVFFIHPTTYTDVVMPMGWNADISNEKVNRRTDKGTILYQASVFNSHCRVFAPRYRQASIRAFFTNDKKVSDAAFDIAYADVKAAFEYYLKHYNNGRPIIIASHSQGTLHAGRLLKEFFEGKALQKQLVCAYLVGMPVFENYFTQLQPCSDSASTGCFISWRTFQEGYVSLFIAKEKNQALVTNPLTWRTDENFGSAKLNKGAILKNFNRIIPGLVHAQKSGNVLWVNKPRFFGSIFLTLKNYHIVDYNLFYVNIRENVQTRIYSFLKGKP
ncbi:MAG: DUF3089 domain-containing protein [Ginsengibacter sp.]